MTFSLDNFAFHRSNLYTKNISNFSFKSLSDLRGLLGVQLIRCEGIVDICMLTIYVDILILHVHYMFMQSLYIKQYEC